MPDWTPPPGSTQTEPGWWIAPNGDLYADPLATEPTLAQKMLKRIEAREEAARRVRRDAASLPVVLDRITALDTQVYVTEMFLETALQMLAERREQIAFLEDLIQGLVLEIPGAVA